MEDQDCDENMPTGLTAMIQDDDDVVSITSDDHDEKAGGGGGGGGPYNMQITPATEFLPFQQMNPGEYPCSEEIIFYDLEKEDEVEENEPGQTGGELCQQQKRKRSNYLHNLNEKVSRVSLVRRQKLQGKMKALQQLIPNCDKVFFLPL
ncbi:PREDICTED: transcription factor PIF3-like [Erythranthe guttata]|uniref:transcription factor PIF3-like n=1 Tax=Erythranthe guttata TaxID=4155 RepID=UPI00064DEEE2|nr:PREDICTED: transcription factor PIF3-like [Erythranthe guttata]|eukprot:XP_012830031.1 PREDICTED: transcription factor PIF3-like [Erythranthe guttata]